MEHLRNIWNNSNPPCFTISEAKTYNPLKLTLHTCQFTQGSSSNHYFSGDRDILQLLRSFLDKKTLRMFWHPKKVAGDFFGITLKKNKSINSIMWYKILLHWLIIIPKKLGSIIPYIPQKTTSCFFHCSTVPLKKKIRCPGKRFEKTTKETCETLHVSNQLLRRSSKKARRSWAFLIYTNPETNIGSPINGI